MYVKGAKGMQKGYMKLFCQKWYTLYKWWEVRVPQGMASPYKTLFSKPLPPGCFGNEVT